MSTGRTSLRRIAAGLALACLASAPAAAQRPNIVLIVIDDAAPMDIGAYGGEIRTPHIDALAGEGALFTNFHAGPTCAPSRAMLMTGVDSHLTGVPTLDHLVPPEHRGLPGQEGELSPGVTTIAEHLSAAGYATYITGKWHLGHSPESLPSARGFDRSFILDASGADNWEDRPYLPLYSRADWFADGQRTGLPEDFYSSEFLVDRMIDFIGETGADQPFFAYIGFQAIHIPVQAPRDFVTRYDGVYDSGWAALREARHAAAVESGLFPAGAAPAAVPDGLRTWEDLSDAERRLSAMSMQVSAGMLEAMDHHVGRFIAHLRETGAYDNTVFVVLSDNGPEHNDPTMRFGFDLWLAVQGYSRDPDRLGERGTYAFIGPEWAAAASAPAAYFKFHAGEGGLRVPLIIAGPGVGARDRLDGLGFITDIAPTLLDLAGAAPLEGGEPFTGRSLAPLLRGEADAAYGPDDAVGIEASGQAALFRGRYKLVRNMAPYGDGVWRLFELEADPGETRDLADAAPALFAEMRAEYDAYAARVGVLEMPAGYSAQANIDAIGMQIALARYGPALLLIALILAGVLGWGGFAARRALRRRRQSGSKA